jgi:hypothetical protein
MVDDGQNMFGRTRARMGQGIHGAGWRWDYTTVGGLWRVFFLPIWGGVGRFLFRSGGRRGLGITYLRSCSGGVCFLWFSLLFPLSTEDTTLHTGSPLPGCHFIYLPLLPDWVLIYLRTITLNTNLVVPLPCCLGMCTLVAGCVVCLF